MVIQRPGFCEYDLNWETKQCSSLKDSGAKHSPSFLRARRPFGRVSTFWRVGDLCMSKFENWKGLQVAMQQRTRCHSRWSFKDLDPFFLILGWRGDSDPHEILFSAFKECWLNVGASHPRLSFVFGSWVSQDTFMSLSERDFFNDLSTFWFDL